MKSKKQKVNSAKNNLVEESMVNVKMEQEEMTKEQITRNDRHRLILVTDWEKYFDYPTIGGLRALIFNEKTNGFNKVIRRINSRVLINVDAYFNWVEEINQQNIA